MIGMMLACSFLLLPIWSTCSAETISRFAAYEPVNSDTTSGSSTSDKPPKAELFGMDTEPVVWGSLFEKWRRAEIDIAQDLEVIERCRATGPCPAPAQSLLALASEGAGRSGRARIGLINRAVNLAITPASDESQWRVQDRWSGPFETLRSKRGDCEDYAIVKYVALLEAGVSKHDLKLVILKTRFPNEDHAAVATRLDGRWLILDNRTFTLVNDTDLARALPEFVLDDSGIRRFV